MRMYWIEDATVGRPKPGPTGELAGPCLGIFNTFLAVTLLGKNFLLCFSEGNSVTFREY